MWDRIPSDFQKKEHSLIVGMISVPDLLIGPIVAKFVTAAAALLLSW